MDINKREDSRINLHFDFSQIKLDHQQPSRRALEIDSEEDSSEEILCQVSKAFGFQHFLLP